VRASANALSHGERAAETMRRRRIIRRTLALLMSRHSGKPIDASALNDLRKSWSQQVLTPQISRGGLSQERRCCHLDDQTEGGAFGLAMRHFGPTAKWQGVASKETTVTLYNRNIFPDL
jgi:hypothetical protein